MEKVREMRKRWIVCILVIVITAFTLNETVSFLNDTEKGSGNEFIAGVIDLEVNGQNPLNGAVVTIDDIEPCNDGCGDGCNDGCHIYYKNITLHMTGDSNPAKVKMHIFNVTNHSSYEGCSPGFWKNHVCKWVGYSPDDTIEDVFDLPPELSEVSSKNLSQALEFGGGSSIVDKAKILLRQAVAAVLNAAHPEINYPLSENDVIGEVNATLATLNTTEILNLKDILDAYNNLGCSLCCDNGISEDIEIDLKLINISSGEEFVLISPDEHKTLSDLKCHWINLTDNPAMPQFEPCINYVLNVSIHLKNIGNKCQGASIMFDIEFYAEQKNGAGFYDIEKSLDNSICIK